MPTWGQIMFQNSNSPIMEHLEAFHDHTMVIIMMICTFILFLLMKYSFNNHIKKNFMEKQEMELFWTTFPSLILIFIALPSLKILYMSDEFMQPNLSLNVIGNQWYWTYNITDLNTENLNTYFLNNNILNLETNNTLILPTKMLIRTLTTSNDVLHSWAIPSLSVKMDATPGRMNQAFITIIRPSILVGQCSEICGSNHSFMPIMINSFNMPQIM